MGAAKELKVSSIGEMRVRLFGEFSVEGATSHELGSRKARVVLKLLALHNGRAVSADGLIEAVWPTSLPAKPSDQLAVLISRLRAVIGRDRITFSDAGYRLHANWVDLDEFNRSAAQAEVAVAAGDNRDSLSHAQTALKLAQEQLLVDELDRSWTQPSRRTAERTAARLRHIVADAALALGDGPAALGVAEDALTANPYDEEALRHLMLAEQRRGCAAAGLAAYARARALLADELGVSPSPATEAVYLALLRDSEAAVPSSQARPTVAASSTLFGRTVEMDLLDLERATVAAGAARLVVVEGEAGIGKSAIINAAGHRAAAAGWLWLQGTCEPLFGELPLQSIVDALAAHVAILTPSEASALLSTEHLLLAPLMGGGMYDHTESWNGGTGSEQRLLHAFAAVLSRLTATQPVLLSIDDVHVAGSSTLELLTYVSRRLQRLLVVVARRRGAGSAIAAHRTIHLGPLERADAIALVGEERGVDLHARTGGNPLFLTLLAASDPNDPDQRVPTSLVEVIAGIADSLGNARATIRAAAVLGGYVDVELLASVLGVAPVELVVDLDAATQRQLLDASGDGYVFRHDLVRVALAETATTAGAAILHRAAARLLLVRPRADPLQVAHHARLGGDLDLAANALEVAATGAASRFDRGAAEDLLDQAIRWADTPARRLARARTRTMRGHYDAALNDVEVAISAGAGASALEVGAWAAYFARRPVMAQAFADDGAALAADQAVRSSCLTIAGRVRHAGGDLGGAEPLLEEAVATAEGPARAIPTVWLGVLRSHQSRPGEALALLRQITRVESAGEHTAELLHALLFTAHSYSLQCRPKEALEALERYEAELAVRQVPRFAGRAANFRGWVLRALGQWDWADDENRRAVDELDDVDFPETRIASALDLAASALLRSDGAAAEDRLAQAEELWTPQLTFGWRLELRMRLERARLGLLYGHTNTAAEIATEIAAQADRLGVPRYASVARLIAARAIHLEGGSVDLDAVGRDVYDLDTTNGIDAWWVTAEVARDFGITAWRDLALTRTRRLARAADGDERVLTAAVQRITPGR